MPGVDYGVWASEDLGVTDPWTRVATAFEDGVIYEDGTLIDVELPFSPGDANRRFFQVRLRDQ